MADDSDLINQDEIEKLLQQSASESTPGKADKPAPAKASQEDLLNQDQIEALLSGGGGTESAKSPAQRATDQAVGDADRLLKQDDIDALLKRSGSTLSEAEKPAPQKDKEATENLELGQGDMPQDDIEYLLNQAQEALESIDSGGDAPQPDGVVAFQLRDFGGTPASTETATLDLIRDIELDLKIELGRTQMYLEDVLRLRKGSVVPLEKLAGDPVDIYVNGRLIARGEVLVLNDNFCVRVGELIAGTNVG